MNYGILVTFAKQGLDAIVTSLISTIIFTISISLINSIKVYRRIKKIKPQFEPTKNISKNCVMILL